MGRASNVSWLVSIPNHYQPIDSPMFHAFLVGLVGSMDWEVEVWALLGVCIGA